MTNGTRPIEQLAANVLEARFDQFDPPTVENAKLRFLDVVGCLVGGAKAPGNAELIGLVREWGGKAEATVLGHGGRVPAHLAALVNSVMARSFDFGPIHPLVDGRGIPGHVSETTVPAALAAGEATGAGGREVITALVAGDDVACRILAGAGFAMGRGWDSTGTVNALGATAIAGRLWGLSQRQLRHAFGIVLNQLAGSFQIIWDRTTSFKLPQGLSAHNGIFAARLAGAGWTGPDDALLGQYGYYELYTDGCTDPAILTRDLGRRYFADSTFKPYPCCRGTHPAVDGALALVYQFGIEPGDIAEVTIGLPARDLNLYYGQPLRMGEFPHAGAIFSCTYAVAVALLEGRVRPEHFTREFMADPRLFAMTERIRMAELPRAREESARVTVRTKDGREFSHFTGTARGGPASPLGRDEILAKFRHNVEFSGLITRANGERLLDLLGNLEKLERLDELIALLAP